MLTLQCKDEKWTRITNVSYNANNTPIEKHVTFKFEWNLERLARVYYDKKGIMNFKYMETERYKQHLTYYTD
jgi:hypothetical protein